MNGVFIVAAKRTPFGAFGGSLKALSATELGVISTKAALEQGNVDPATVDQVYFGNVIQSCPDAAYLARHVGLKSGLPVSTPALTVNRLCGSGFETVVQGANAISLGNSKIALCGGAENMSAAPLSVDGNDSRWGISLGKGLPLRDSLWDGLTDTHAGMPMGVTAENLAVKYNISRLECDEYAIRSQETWGEAQKRGIFQHEIAPVEITSRKGTKMIVDTDEHPRPDTTLEKISSLAPVFQKDGVVTAANASGICDGAGSVILASQEAVHEYNLKPMARLVSYGITGCDPTIMGIGPVRAIQQALNNGGLKVEDIDRLEINEAFAAQTLSCIKEGGFDIAKTNLHGGAISLGHPLGASGSRIVAHLAHEFQWNNDGNIYVGSACIGGGQGIAVVLERV
jgi:acetyl-CoA acyltransferase 2